MLPGSVEVARPRRNSRTVRAIGPFAAGIVWLVFVVVVVRAHWVDSRIEVSAEASVRASSERSNATPQAGPDTALIPGSRVDAGVPPRPLPEHALQSEATAAAPSQDRPSAVLSGDAAVAGSEADQSKARDGAAALGPNQSGPKAGQPAAAPAQAEENDRSLTAEEDAEKPPLSNEPRPSTDESGQEPAHLAEAATAEPARLHSVAPEQGSRERSGASSAGIRIFIHYASSDVASAALAHRLAGYLQRVGFTVADIRTVDFRIGKPSVRYFFEDDRNDSQRLVEAVERFLENAQSRSPQRASDFTHFIPKPRPGNVEVWLPALVVRGGGRRGNEECQDEGAGSASRDSGATPERR